MTWKRYVAIGDSTTEGMDDPDGAGGYRGWADRFAEKVAAAQGGLEYANLAIRGMGAAQVHESQLAAALALAPDLATVVAGMNDILRSSFDPVAVADHVYTMQDALIAQGATVITFTLPDLAPVMPIARPIARQLSARVVAMNHALRAATANSGAILLDLGAYPMASDPRLWSGDRLHANSAGHARIADALADAAGLPGSDDSWKLPLPPPVRRGRHQVLRAELAWVRVHLMPWIVRHMRGRSSGDGRTAKRPVPTAVSVSSTEDDAR